MKRATEHPENPRRYHAAERAKQNDRHRGIDSVAQH